MSSKRIQISIPKPCSEDWSKMTPTERGRFCAMCTKEVVDFTKMSREETMAIIKRTSKICGRFYENEIANNLIFNQTIVAKRKGFNWLDKLVAASLVLFTFNSLKAQGSPSMIHSQVSETGIVVATGDSTKIETPTTDQVIIRGTITDFETQEPISYAIIVAQNTKAGCSSDLNGKFELVLPESFEGDSLLLMIKFVGYSEKRITIYRKDFSIDLEVTLDVVPPKVEPVVIGGVVILSPWKRFWYRMKFWKRRK